MYLSGIEFKTLAKDILNYKCKTKDDVINLIVDNMSEYDIEHLIQDYYSIKEEELEESDIKDNE